MMIDECYCCTCEKVYDPITASLVYKIDLACRNHGAHGKRECESHKMPPEPCTWDSYCGMDIEAVSSRPH